MTLSTFLIILLVLVILAYFIKRWANGPMNLIKKDLTDKFVIVTGSSDGIGVETAKDLLKSNAKVVFACRNKSKTENIINSLPEKLKKNAIFLQLDLESFKSIENFSKEIKSKYPKIDILINNAGIAWLNLDKTEDDFINIYQVNYLGNVLLTLLLLDHFNEKESKIVNVSSRAYKRSQIEYGYSKYMSNFDEMKNYYSQMKRNHVIYADTKLLLVYFSQYLANFFEKKYPYLKIVCLHPGVIFTNIFKIDKLIFKLLFHLIFKNIFYFFTKDIVHGAQTTLFLSYSDNKDLANGGYYSDLKLEKYTPKGKDEKLRNEMVNETLKILKGKYKELEFLPLSE